jgi:hypothetical protein
MHLIKGKEFPFKQVPSSIIQQKPQCHPDFQVDLVASICISKKARPSPK